MQRILTAIIAVAVAAFAIGEPGPTSASRPPLVYGEKGAVNVEANLWRRHAPPYAHGYVYQPYAYYEPYAYYGGPYPYYGYYSRPGGLSFGF
jgi:hypothetical protein